MLGLVPVSLEAPLAFWLPWLQQPVCFQRRLWPAGSRRSPKNLLVHLLSLNLFPDTPLFSLESPFPFPTACAVRSPAGPLPRLDAPSPSPAVLEISLLQGQVPGACSQSNCEIIMVGDFNLNWMEKCCTTADSFAMDFHLTKLISQPTRLYLKVVIIHY